MACALVDRRTPSFVVRCLRCSPSGLPLSISTRYGAELSFVEVVVGSAGMEEREFPTSKQMHPQRQATSAGALPGASSNNAGVLATLFEGFKVHPSPRAYLGPFETAGAMHQFPLPVGYCLPTDGSRTGYRRVFGDKHRRGPSCLISLFQSTETLYRSPCEHFAP